MCLHSREHACAHIHYAHTHQCKAQACTHKTYSVTNVVHFLGVFLSDFVTFFHINRVRSDGFLYQTWPKFQKLSQCLK